MSDEKHAEKIRFRKAILGDTVVRAQSEAGPAERVVPLRWTTSAEVVRFGWVPDYGFSEFREILYPDGVSLDRLNSGAALLDSHDAYTTRSVVGVVVDGSARMDGPDGYADVRLSNAPGDADITQKIEDKIIRNVSVGYSIDDHEWRQPKGGPVELHVKRWTPLEISAVPIPADAGAQFLRAMGAPCLNEGKMSDKIQTPEVTPATPAAVDVAKIQQDERDRVRFCENFAARQGIDPAKAREVIDRGEPKDATVVALWELAAARAAEVGPKQVGFGATIGAEPMDHLRERIQAAILVRMGEGNAQIKGVVRESDRVLAGEMARGGFVDFARMIGEATGQPMPRFALQHEIIERACAPARTQYRAGGSMTSSDLPGITVDAINVAIVRLSEVADIDYSLFCEPYNPSVHKSIHFPVLSSGFLLDAVTEHQEAQIATMSDSDETADMQTFTKAFAISHILMQNDRFGEIARQTGQFGMAIPRTRLNTVMTAVASNPTMSDSTTFYHADHGNLAGTGAVPSVSNLTSAFTDMYAQTDLEGNPIGAQPVVFVGPVGPALTAGQIFGQTVTPAVLTSLTTVLPTRVRNSIVQIIDHPRLTGTAWYLFGTVTKPFFAGTIDGSNLPAVVSEYDSAFRTFKITISDNFYCAPINWRVAYKNAGA